MHVIEIKTGVSGYLALLSHVLQHGRASEPRGVPTLDAGPTTIVMHDVVNALPLGTGRNLNRSIAAAEALQLIGGFSDPRLLPATFDRYREPDGTFWGAYGDRVGNQLFAQVQKLTADPETRQSVVTLWSPYRDNEPEKRDYPCTVALMFWRDEDRLAMMTVMRSQDVWLGTPYDWFQFTQLQQTLARVLGIPPGIYRHVTTSTHLYLRDVDAAENLVTRWYAPGGLADEEREWQPRGLGRDPHVQGYDVLETFPNVQHRAHLLRVGAYDPNNGLKHPTPSEEWYAEHLTVRTDT